MTLIPLTQGQFASVDDSDYAELSQWTWHAHKRSDGKGFYAARMCNRRVVLMHRVLLPTELRVDHRNGNGLDNTRENLRPATQQQNCFNRVKRKPGTSKFKGVSFDSKTGLWRARITLSGVTLTIGYYPTDEEASNAYRTRASVLFGAFAA